MRRAPWTLTAFAVALAAFAAPALADGGGVTRLAGLITRAAESANPALTFLTGFQDLGDIDLDQAEIRQALTRADVPESSTLDDLLRSTTRIGKRGNTVRIQRTEVTPIDLGEEAAIQLGKTIRFDLSQVSRKSSSRLAKSTGPIYQLAKIEGIEVGENQDKLYNLYKLYYAEERGRPVLHINAGVFFYSEWRRIELPAPAPETPGEGSGLTGALQESSK